jgi:hypothetical protein
LLVLNDSTNSAMMSPLPMHPPSETPRLWLEHEVENLIRLVDEGVPVTRICMLLDRSLDDVELKLKELAIKPNNQTI